MKIGDGMGSPTQTAQLKEFSGAHSLMCSISRETIGSFESSRFFRMFQSFVHLSPLQHQDLPPGWEVVTSKSTGKQWHGMAGEVALLKQPLEVA